jgi:hypothetical protein
MEKVTFNNINEFLKKYSFKDVNCSHDFPVDYSEIGHMLDDSYGYLSYLDFKTNNDNEIFIGSYPYNSAKLWQCQKCQKLTFSFTDDSGWGRLTPLKIDFNKEYLSEPANKSVSINPNRLEEFASRFDLPELLSQNTLNEYTGIKIISKDKKSIFGFRINKTTNGDMINFEVVANRTILQSMAKFEKE